MAIQHHSARRRPVTCVALILAVIALAIPVSASAAVAVDCSNPTTSQYGSSDDQLTNCATHNGGGGPTIAGLPFTGLDIGVLAIAAVGLLGAGVALRRFSDPSRHST